MKLFKTALQSLLGNGLKTWLNVFVLSISFVMIVLMQGLLQGWSKQAIEDTRKWEVGDGVYWNDKYDPWDFFTIDSSTAIIPEVFRPAIKQKQLEPVLITQGTIYPNGRMQGVLLKGIRPDQQILDLPTHFLKTESDEIPVMIGVYTAKQSKLKMNDVLTLRWRDKYGTFEAADIRIVGIFKSSVPAVDVGTVWLALETLEKMTMNVGCANILIKSPEIEVVETPEWNFKSVEKLTESTMLMVKTKSKGTSVMYFVFLLLAMLAIFDTQTLSIFRRQKEIGTMIALGMTQKQVVWHFTLEGSLNALLALILGTVWGAPLFWYFSVKGLKIPMDAADFGLPMGDVMYTLITPSLVIGTIIFIFLVTAIVSYLPARKIAKMNPTDAIRGKVL